MSVELHLGDCLTILPTLEANSIDSIITDPPYGLNFMSSKWDHGVPGVAFWEEALRVAKPGSFLLAFGGTRTFHRLTVAIEDAGWEIRDCLMWLHAQGFPKGIAIDKAIDKHFGKEREVVGVKRSGLSMNGNLNDDNWHNANGDEQAKHIPITAPATPEAAQWLGWHSALKPAWESILVAQKPFPEQSERDIIVGNLYKKEAQLWLLLHVSTAGHSSTFSQDELNEVLSIAQWSAEKLTSTQADLCGQMDTSQFVSTVNTCLSIVTSWKRTLAELWNPGNTSTISTASSGIIDSKTLSYLLSQTTLKNMLQAELTAPGSQLAALPAGAYLNAVSASISSTRMLSAIESATYEGHIKHQAGTAELSPAWEPIILAMKPLDKNFAHNALTWGVGGLNIDQCRIPAEPELAKNWQRNQSQSAKEGRNSMNGGLDTIDLRGYTPQGRWPSNLLLDDQAAALLDQMSGERKVGGAPQGSTKRNIYGDFGAIPTAYHGNDGNGASRFFLRVAHDEDDVPSRMAYFPKASRRDRDSDGAVNNTHPTCKPSTLMKYLCKLICPPGGTILDPFAGSGSTLVAAILEGFDCVGIELDPEYLAIAQARCDHAQRQAARADVRAQLPLLEAAG